MIENPTYHSFNIGNVFYPLLPILITLNAILYRRIIIISKLYTRPSLLILFMTVIGCKSSLSRVELYIYPELFNYFGKFRSRLVGENLIKLFFLACDKINYFTKETKEVILIYLRKGLTHKLKPFNPYCNRKEGRDSPRYKIIINEVEEDLIKYIINRAELYPDVNICILCKDYTINEASGSNITILREYSIDTFEELIASSEYVIRNLTCDGRLIAQGQSLIIKDIQHNNSITITNDIRCAIDDLYQSF